MSTTLLDYINQAEAEAKAEAQAQEAERKAAHQCAISESLANAVQQADLLAKTILKPEVRLLFRCRVIYTLNEQWQPGHPPFADWTLVLDTIFPEGITLQCLSADAWAPVSDGSIRLPARVPALSLSFYVSSYPSAQRRATSPDAIIVRADETADIQGKKIAAFIAPAVRECIQQRADAEQRKANKERHDAEEAQRAALNRAYQDRESTARAEAQRQLEAAVAAAKAELEAERTAVIAASWPKGKTIMVYALSYVAGYDSEGCPKTLDWFVLQPSPYHTDNDGGRWFQRIESARLVPFKLIAPHGYTITPMQWSAVHDLPYGFACRGEFTRSVTVDRSFEGWNGSEDRIRLIGEVALPPVYYAPPHILAAGGYLT